MTPFQTLYGRPPPTISIYIEGNSPVHEVDKLLTCRDTLLYQLKTALHAANNRMKQQTDTKRRILEFNVGNLVFLKLHPYRQHSVLRRAYHKLANKFYGPFPIEERIGKVVYCLTLPPSSRIHLVFHVTLLKKQISPHGSTSSTLPPMTNTTIPDIVLDYHWIKRGSKFIEQALMQWHKLSLEDATWEDTTLLWTQFPDFHLEDKVACHKDEQ